MGLPKGGHRILTDAFAGRLLQHRVRLLGNTVMLPDYCYLLFDRLFASVLFWLFLRLGL